MPNRKAKRDIRKGKPAVEYPSTTEIMADLHELEREITAGLAELEGML